MKPSPEFQRLLDDGSRTGWNLAARTLAHRLAQVECSPAMADLVRREGTFMPNESVLPPENVQSLRAALALDPGRLDDAAQAFSTGTHVTRASTNTRSGSHEFAAGPETSEQFLARAERNLDAAIQEGRISVRYSNERGASASAPTVQDVSAPVSAPATQSSPKVDSGTFLFFEKRRTADNKVECLKVHTNGIWRTVGGQTAWIPNDDLAVTPAPRPASTPSAPRTISGPTPSPTTHPLRPDWKMEGFPTARHAELFEKAEAEGRVKIFGVGRS